MPSKRLRGFSRKIKGFAVPFKRFWANISLDKNRWQKAEARIARGKFSEKQLEWLAIGSGKEAHMYVMTGGMPG